MLALCLPALWNRYPLLQFDTGGYLARWYEGYLVPSRSTVYGLYLHLGEGFHFWPEIVAQSALTIWIVALTLRVFGLAAGAWRVAVCVVVLAGATALSLLASILLTDIFAGIAVLALHILVFRFGALTRWERLALTFAVAFAASTHGATFAVLLGLIVAYVFAAALTRAIVPLRGLMYGIAACALGAGMLLAANFAISGELAWTPGGYGLAFGRMLQDGIVARYLKEHCPDPQLRLCAYRDRLPDNADDFLWGQSVFNELGRFRGLGGEMQLIVHRSVLAYPVLQIETAAVATAQQLVEVANGEGVHNDIWHTYGIIRHFIPREVPAMDAARQQQSLFDFDAINRVQVPITLASMALTFALALSAMWRRWRNDLALLAATVSLALLGNAFVCGAISGPHDRYGARIVWIATFVVGLALMRALTRRQASSEDSTTTSYIETPAACPDRRNGTPSAT